MNPPADQPPLSPWDVHNRALVEQARPPGWVNPVPAARYNLVIIGGGTAGLVTAAGAAGLGAKVALVEKHLMGGDCLNTGCVPSKCMIRSAHAAADARDLARFGVRISGTVSVDFPVVAERMRKVRADISHHDSVKRFSEMGIDVFLGEACFSGPDTVRVEKETLRFRRAVIATGARAVDPSIEGLKQAGYLTNETIFSLTECPKRLAVIGGGPIGCELAQTFQRLGSQVILFHKNAHLLDREDAEAARILQGRFMQEGMQLILPARIRWVEATSEGKAIHYELEGKSGSVVVEEILTAAGRAPNVNQLNLESIGVEFNSRDGVAVNDFLQTTNRRIYAAGDVCMNWKFTHAADAAARIVIQNALFHGRKRLSALTMPWTTYTDPEIAHVGIYERQARERGIDLDTYFRPFTQVDRALTDGEEEGFVKVHTAKGSDRILGATIVARHAGEMINEITLAIVARIGLGTLANVIHSYPTQAEAIKQCGDAFNRTRLTPRVRRLFASWLRWTR